MTDPIMLFYVTVPNLDTAQKIAKHLLKRKLIACANIFPPHTSVYEWKGEIKTEQEQVIILKTREQKAPSVETEVKALHPYDCPCIVQLKPHSCNSEFLHWLLEQIP